jgi:hypothetical protein
MQTSPPPSTAPSSPPSVIRRALSGWTVVFIIIGGILQGIGNNIERFGNSDASWGGAGVAIGVIFAAWFARRLRWWLLLFIPIIVILMVPIALITEIATARVVSRAVDQVGSCRGLQDLEAELAPISAGMKAFMEDINSTASPDVTDARRWAASANTLRQQYEALDHPPAFDRYVELSVQTMRSYEQGFDAMAMGDYDNGDVLLVRGDDMLLEAQAAFREAGAECAR